MKRCTQRGRLVAHGLLCLVLVGGSVGAVYAQRVFTSQRWGWYRMPPRFPEGTADRRFTFARVMYRSVTRESRGQGWTTDYPSADINFMVRLSELTTTRISKDRASEPGHVVVTLTDDRLFNYPFIFMSDVGTAGPRRRRGRALASLPRQGRVSVGRRLLGATGVGALGRSNRARAAAIHVSGLRDPPPTRSSGGSMRWTTSRRFRGFSSGG